MPEKREERTTEGGLDVVGQHNHLKPMVARLGDAGIRVSLFIEADPRQLDAAVSLGAPVVELHTGALLRDRGRGAEGASSRASRRPRPTARSSGSNAMPAMASTTRTSAPIAAIPNVRELNIGHFLIGEAIFVGLKDAIREMRRLMDEARRPGSTA